MTNHTFQWQTTDNLTIQAQSWEPERRIKAVICLVHGLGEHSNRYAHFAAFFTEQGYAVITYDQRGHGKSEGKRGHTPSFNHLLEDVTELLNLSEERFPGIPRLLYGHSMGGNLALNYGIHYKPKIEGITASGPWIKLAFEPPKFKVTLGKLMNSIYPAFSQGNELDPNLISRDPETVEQYKNDELVHNVISAALFFETYQAGYAIIDNAAKLTLPVLLMHGSEDYLTSHKGSRQLADNAGNNLTYKEWEGFYHEIHNDPEREEVMQYTLNWIEKHL